MNREQQVAAVPFWWHSIDLGGIVTPGWKTPKIHREEWAAFALPNLNGKTVLDVGAWDGYYSFACEREGAAVTALDQWNWPLSLLSNGLQGTEVGDEVPAKLGFDTAHAALKSSVEARVGGFMPADLEEFDVVLFLGVLYHLPNPFAALCKLARITRDLAIIETEAIGGCRGRALCEFFETDELGADMDSWWVPSMAAVLGMCRRAGFKSAEAVSPRVEPERGRYRLVVHATK